MPTNVTPEYRKAEEAFRQAKTLDEKIERMEDMISLLPKHKGTDHLFADLKRRLSRLRRQQETAGKKGRAGYGLDFLREGAAQVILVGPPNSGKSSILKALTHARPEVGDYPFTTQRMMPGMIPYEDIQIQLVDSPPVTSDFMPMHLLSLVRGADAALIVADLSRDMLLDDIDVVINAFAARHVVFVKEQEEQDRDRILCRILANKLDAPQAEERLDLLKEMLRDRLEVLPISCRDPESISGLGRMIFQWLGIMRVYSKAPGKKVDMDRPYTVFPGQTVEDVCSLVHKDFYENLKFARLWRGDTGPITVSRTEPVQDRDILELHM
jgi:ribosome-interacting GTPase 1